VRDALPDSSGVRVRGRELGVPRVVMAMADILSLPLDTRAGYLLSRIDGQTSVDGLVDVTGFPTSEVIALLVLLTSLGAIVVDTTSSSER
jgi:hypothetical protein